MHRRLALAALPVALALVLAQGSTSAKPPLRLVVVANGLKQPIYVAATSSEPGRVYIVERRGTVRLLEGGRVRPTPFLNLSALVTSAGERGLLSIAFHPSYATTRLVYAAYTARGGAVTVDELRTDGLKALPETRRTLVQIPHDDLYHNGGQLQFGPDGLLYVGVGDGGYVGNDPDPDGNSQTLEVLLGKIFTLDVSQASPTPTIVAYGLRNPWRFSFRPGTRELLIADVGWNYWEELDRLPETTPRPANFGWSVYEGRRKRTRGTLPKLNPAGPLIWPSLAYETRVKGNCSITGGYVYRGKAVPRLAGRYVFGDYCSGRIWSVAVSETAVGKKRLEPVKVPNLVSFGEDASGELYALAQRGTVYRVAR